jgi:outer membrane protein TolC
LPAPQLSSAKLTAVFPEKIPSDLLARRPDLQALLSQVEASRIEVGAAKLDYLPNFDLQGNFGFQSYGISNLLTLPSQMFGIGPVMSLPIFDGGRIDANVAAKEAGRNQAIADYHDGLLHALKQSADGIAGFKNAKNDLNHLEDGAQSMRKINDAFIERGNRGIVSKEQIEISETNLLKQEQALADGQARLFAAHVGLIQALGGGYSQVDVKNK